MDLFRIHEQVIAERFFEISVVRAALQALAREPRDEDGADALGAVLLRQGFAPERPPADGAALDRHESLCALTALVRGLDPHLRRTVADLSAELGRQAAAERDPSHELGVSVGTIHAAKGSEWDVALLPRLTDGSLPASYATTVEQQAEERRLFYVAVTRARRHLDLSWARVDKGHEQRRSPFLDMFPAATPEPGPRPKPRPTPTPSRWPVGTRVHHDRYGIGKVVSLAPGFAVVDFGGSYGQRRISITTRKMSRLP